MKRGYIMEGEANEVNIQRQRLGEEGEIASIQEFRDCVHEEWMRGLLAEKGSSDQRKGSWLPLWARHRPEAGQAELRPGFHTLST